MSERPFPLKPMTVGNILDYSFRIYRNNFKSIITFSVLIGGLFNLVLLVLTKLAAPPGTFVNPWPYIIDGIKTGNWESIFNSILNQQVSPALIGPDFFIRSLLMIIIAYGGTFILYVFINPFVHGGIINIASDYFHGVPSNVSTAFKKIGEKYGKLVLTALSLVVCYMGVSIVCFILIIVFVLIIGLSSVGLSAVGGGEVAILIGFVVFFIVLALIFAVCFASISFVYPVAISEGVYHFNAIGRSFKLAFKKFWRVLGVNILAYLLVSILNTAIAGIMILIAVLSPVQILFQEILTLFTSAIAAPIIYIATTMLYFDMRIRTEGYDLELLSDEMKENEQWENTSY
ncbi:MAG: hypothetical protein GX066_07200 [Clostridiaceae bacterium]|nr:hypothetical protein [Clostridiaceae bacterium]